MIARTKRWLLVAAVMWSWCVRAAELTLPNRGDSFRFAVIGDTGTGGRHQYEIGARLAESHRSFPFDVVLMLGDNMYGRTDFERKFGLPYKTLLDRGVNFRAVLGNHDRLEQCRYKPFHMAGRRYYRFEPRPGIACFGLDSTFMDRAQLAWIQAELAASAARWKIVYLHHPLYSSGGRHGSDLVLRGELEPLFVKYSVNLVLSGHDHFYERLKPQNGIRYFVVGGSAKLRKRNVLKTKLTAKAFDTDNSYLLMEIAGDRLHFQAISRAGDTIDRGTFDRDEAAPK